MSIGNYLLAAAAGVSKGPTSTYTLYTWGDNVYGELGSNTTNARSSPTQLTTGFTSIANGDNFSVGIKSDGSLWAWGNDSNYQIGDGVAIINSIPLHRSSPVQIGTQKSWTQVAAGYSHALAIATDKTMWAWGDNSSSQAAGTVTWKVGHITGYNVSNFYSLLLRSDGITYGIGSTSQGQFGSGSLSDNYGGTFQYTGNKINFSKLISGTYSVGGITEDNSIYVWGQNNFGQLGLNNRTTQNSAVKLTGYTATTGVFGGISQGGALGFIDTQNRLYMVGNGTYGKLGQNESIHRSNPVQVPGSWSQISISFFSTVLAIQSDGSLWSWGYNVSGQMGVNDRISRSSPVQITSSKSFTFVYAGAGDSYAIATDGTLWAWGYLLPFTGISGTNFYRSTPVQIPGSWSQIVSSDSYVNAIQADGTLWVWGNNTAGVLGTGDTVARSSPVQISAGNTFSFISTIETGSWPGSIAITTDGRLFSWGDGSAYYFIPGINTFTTRNTPVEAVYGLSGVTTLNSNPIPAKIGTSSWNFVSAGASHSVAIDSSNKLWTWGANDKFQLGLSTNVARSSPTQISTVSTSSFVSVTSGPNHNIATDSTGRVWGWGLNTSGELGPITRSWSVVMVKGATCTLHALDEFGLLWGWGYNTNGEIGLGTAGANVSSPTLVMPDKNFKDISSGFFAIDTNNTLWGWGLGGPSLGQNTSVATVYSSPVFMASNVAFAHGSLYQTFFIKTDGSLWGTGNGSFGALGLSSTTDRSSPVQLATGSSFTMVRGFANGGMAIKTDGTLWAWGIGTTGQLAQNDAISKSSPVQIAGSWSYIATAFSTLFGISASTVYGWGANASGQLGINANTNRSNPTQIYNISTEITSFVQIWGTSNATGLLDSQGYLWGVQNLKGAGGIQSGTWPTDTVASIPSLLWSAAGTHNSPSVFTTRYKHIPKWASIARPQSQTNTCNAFAAITTEGALYYFGPPYSGQMGIPGVPDLQTIRRSSPVQVGLYHPYVAQPRLIPLGYSPTLSPANALSTSAGASHSVFVTSDYQVYSTGQNNNGQRGIPTSLMDFCWGYGSNYIGLDTAGNMYSGGGLTYAGYSPAVSRSLPTQVQSTSQWSDAGGAYMRNEYPLFKRVQAGFNQNLAALDYDDRLYVWGNNGGRLGLGDTLLRPAPVRQFYGQRVKYLSVNSSAQVVVIDTNNVLWGWGVNSGGELGLGDVLVKSYPVILKEGSPVNWVTNNSYATIFQTTDGTIWGSGFNGTTSDYFNTGTSMYRSSPVQIFANASEYVSGIMHVQATNLLLMKSDKTLWTYGANNYGNLGQGDRINRSSPVQIPGSWAMVAAAYQACVGIKTDGTLWGWGNPFGLKLGFGDSVARSTPIQITANSGAVTSFTQVYLGNPAMIAVDSTGTVWSAGDPGTGTGLGANLQTDFLAKSYLTQVPGLMNLFSANQGISALVQINSKYTNPAIPWSFYTKSYTQITAKGDSTYLLSADKTLWAWGNNANGQLGTGDNVKRSFPVQVTLPAGSSVVQIGAGTSHATLITKSP